ncbi:centrosomal protein 43 isoform X3 [Aplysia californica]|uniref:Centrosomal protein 43 n=1 Tax=Aplysia californica TaxID=6500 RepID=A0ABM1A7B2_APLCA|nr:centrosomal protein 43 isoform X3 [Aplysia californica]
MSADEDTELRDLVAQTLETNGTLGKIRAQLRASVFLALEDQENGQSKTPFLNKGLRSFLSTKEGQLTASLVQEFLEFFNLEFTLAVFKPEIGLNEQMKRTELIKDLNLNNTTAPPNAPLITCLLKNDGQTNQHRSSVGAGDHSHISGSESHRDLSEKQISDAREKFNFYDKDHSGAIDKDELRELFLDMFPNFHQNMLERYVNDEFKATDKNFSSSMYSLTPKAIDFDEFLGMYKRLFLLCRTVVSGDVADIVSPSHKPGTKSQQQLPSQSSQVQGKVNPPASSNSDANNAARKADENLGADRLGSDIEEDPFFDDIPTSSVQFSTLSNYITAPSRRSFLSELEKNKEMQAEPKENGDSKQAKDKPAGSGMSSLDGLPSLSPGRGSGMGSLAGAPPLGRPKSPVDDPNDSDVDKNLREIDKRMKDFGLDSQNDDFEYEDDFSPDLSQKTPGNSKSAAKPENGSVAEEIDDEEIDEDISIEADDLLNSEKSGFDDLTTDRSISQADGGFDYMEDPTF